VNTPEFVIRSSRVVTPDGVGPADIRVRDGLIVGVSQPTPGPGVIDVGDLAVLPGLVDSHVHVNDPGTDWEGFESATTAAAAGGVTTIIDMPLNSLPVTCTADALAIKEMAASGSARVDYGFWGGVIPGNGDQLSELAAAGVRGFKCFLIDSGLPAFPPVGPADLREAMRVIAELDSVLLVHAELPGPIEAVTDWIPASSSSHDDWLASRPAAAEVEAVRLVIEASRETGCAAHIVHVSAAESLAVLREARADDVRITAETCPHYLSFTSETVPESATAFKCAPPIRDASNRARLWEGLATGDLDLVASDHSPCPPSMKGTGDFFSCWGGITSLQVGLSATWTEAVARGHDLGDLARWMSQGPARLAGLGGRKGRIAPGYDADLVIFNPDRLHRWSPRRTSDRRASA
jgi:allantoinase